MRVLLIIAHGSPRPEANGDVIRVADLVRERTGAPVVVGYLDCNQPDVPAAIDECVATGATEIAVVPYFLHSGRHFLLDLPELLADGARRHRGVAIMMGDYLGREPHIAEILRDRFRAAGA